MEKPELVSFDCAHTLIETNWTLDGFARRCLSEIGLTIPEPAFPRLLELFRQNLPAFLAVNLTRDPVIGEGFWRQLTREWFNEFGISESWLDPARAAADRLAYGPNSELFRLYPDVLHCLDTLASEGYRLAIISNWDYGLHRVIRDAGIGDRFEVILASLEEGVEKPDPRLFEICLEKMRVAPSRAVHVGDDPVDDVQGAEAAGIRPILLDRTGGAAMSSRISTLADLPEVLRWTD